MFHLDQLKAFVESADCGSFSAAARVMGKSHSTISVAINNLEITFGVQLFDRKQKYPVLTSIGEQLYQQSVLILRQSERMQAMASSKSNQEEEVLHVGVDELLPFAYIESELARLANTFPYTSISLVRGDGGDLQEKAVQNKLDLVVQLNRGAVSDVLDFYDLQPLVWDCVCSPDSALADMDIVPTETLLSTRQICCSGANNNPLMDVNSQIGIESWQATSLQDVARMVEEDIGWAYLPKVLAQERIANGTLQRFTPEYNQEGIPNFTPVDMLISPGRQAGPVLRCLMNLLQSKPKHVEGS